MLPPSAGCLADDLLEDDREMGLGLKADVQRDAGDRQIRIEQ